MGRDSKLGKITWVPHFNVFNRTSREANKFKQKASISKAGLNEVLQTSNDLNAGRFTNISNYKKNKRNKFFIRSLHSTGDNLVKRYKKVTLSEWLKEHKLDTSNINRFVGVTPDYVGFAPSKPVYQKDNIFVSYLSSGKYSKDCSGYSSYMNKSILKVMKDFRLVYSGGNDTNGKQYKNFLVNNKHPKREIRSRVKYLIDKLQKSDAGYFLDAPVAEFYNGDELLNCVKTKLTSNPGHYTSMLMGRSKSKTLHISRLVSSMIFKRLQTNNVKNNYLWGSGKREKDISLSTQGEKDTRLVWCLEHPMSHFLMWVNQKLQMSYKSSVNTRKTFDVSGAYSNKKAKLLYSNKEKFDYYIDADWSTFDSTQDTEYLILAGAILTSEWPTDIKSNRYHRRLAYTYIKSIISKNLLIPPGIVVEVNRGVASGHPSTTLVNCLVNTIWWIEIAIAIYGPSFKDMIKIEVYGDDALVFFKEHPNLKNIDKYIKKHLPAISGELKYSLRSTNETDLEYTPDYLKRFYVDDKIIWNKKKMWDKLVYPWDTRTIEEQVMLLIGYLQQAPEDHDLLLLCNNILEPYINRKYLSQDKYTYALSIINRGSSYEDILFQFSNFYVGYNTYSFSDSEDLYNYSCCYYKPSRDMQEIRTKITTSKLNLMYALNFPPWVLELYNIDEFDVLKGGFVGYDRLSSSFDDFYKSVSIIANRYLEKRIQRNDFRTYESIRPNGFNSYFEEQIRRLKEETKQELKEFNLPNISKKDTDLLIDFNKVFPMIDDRIIADESYPEIDTIQQQKFIKGLEKKWKQKNSRKNRLFRRVIKFLFPILE